MKFIVFGLGSMGKRRIRCLQALKFEHIAGYDLRADRCEEAKNKYSIEIIPELSESYLKEADAYIISTPPDKHEYYIKLAIQYHKPAFIEASVIIEGLNELNEMAKRENVILAPSCTLQFHPVIKNIKEIIQSKKYGRVTNFTYYSGNFLPDWHPWEKVSDFYVSNRRTGGGREIVPFELTWICDAIGFPSAIKGHFNSTLDVGANIEDTYSFTMKYPRCLGTVNVDVAARYALRNLILNFENAQIIWRWDSNFFELFEASEKRWIRYYQPEGNAEPGYNKNIIEDMYIDEIGSFVKSISSGATFPSSLDYDIKILDLLNQIEKSDGGF